MLVDWELGVPTFSTRDLGGHTQNEARIGYLEFRSVSVKCSVECVRLPWGAVAGYPPFDKEREFHPRETDHSTRSTKI